MTRSSSSLTEEDRSNLVAYLDGELDEAGVRTLEAKLNRDPAARAEVDALRQTWALLDYLPQAEPSQSFTSRTLERIATPPSHRIWSWLKSRQGWLIGSGWTAAVLIAGLAGIASVSALLPRQPTDDELLRDWRIINNQRVYKQAESLEFLRELDRPELFGDDHLGP